MDRSTKCLPDIPLFLQLLVDLLDFLRRYVFIDVDNVKCQLAVHTNRIHIGPKIFYSEILQYLFHILLIFDGHHDIRTGGSIR
ncbi:MAG TPA: hypothetical protein DEB39_06155 [Planctomycetaceae bacterium]|nr:hypothetical protein [Planctomycetaceae bacterium]